MFCTICGVSETGGLGDCQTNIILHLHAFSTFVSTLWQRQLVVATSMLCCLGCIAMLPRLYRYAALPNTSASPCFMLHRGLLLVACQSQRCLICIPAVYLGCRSGMAVYTTCKSGSGAMHHVHPDAGCRLLLPCQQNCQVSNASEIW